MSVVIDKVSQYTAREMAVEKFVVIEGYGLGTKFLDTDNYYQVTIHNVAEFINGMTEEPIQPKDISFMQFKSILEESVYRPDEDTLYRNEAGYLQCNDWRPAQIQPMDATTAFQKVQPFLNYLEDGFGEHGQYIARFLAFKLQHPLKKPHVILYLYGGQGSGKTTIANIIEAVFGSRAISRVSDASQLGSMSAIDIWKRTLLIVEEVEVKTGSGIANTIKAMTGAEAADSHRKGEHFKQHLIPANLIMLSNNPPSLLDKDDRRFFVKRMATQPDPERYFSNFYHWLKEQNGLEAISGYLKNLDVSDFNLSDRPPMTMEKELACGKATQQDILDALEIIELRPKKLLWLPSDFKDVFNNGNRVMHVLDEIGLEQALLPKRAKVANLTEAQTKRLFILAGHVLEKDVHKKNAWVVKCPDGTGVLAKDTLMIRECEY